MKLMNNFYLILFLVCTIYFNQSLTSYSQDSIRNKVLILERTKKTSIQNRTITAEFKEKTNTVVKRFSNEKRIRGRIEHIADSSITINGTKILVKDIKSIHRNRSKVALILGAPMMFLSISANIYYKDLPKYNEYGEKVDYSLSILTSMAAIIVSGIEITISSIILASVKHYNIGEKWIISTIEK